MKPPTHTKQTGVALITALLIVSIAVTTSVFLTGDHQLSIRRTGNIINGNQAYLYALGAEALGMSVLHQDRQDSEIDSLEEDWATDTPPLPVDGGFVAGNIEDLQGRFNINNLIKDGKIDPVSVARFERLLEQFELEPTISQAVIDWLDDNFEAGGSAGAEDDYYAGLEIPYRTANSRFSSTSELRMIRGLEDADKLALLLPHITALPTHTPVNVNTASTEVLIALGLDESAAESVTQQPKSAEVTESESGIEITENNNSSNEVFETIDAFLQAAGVENSGEFQRNDLSVSSEYFLVSGEARVDRGRASLRSVIHRNNEGLMRVIIRSQSVL